MCRDIRDKVISITVYKFMLQSNTETILDDFLGLNPLPEAVYFHEL